VQNRARCGAILTPNEHVYSFGDSCVLASFGENRSRNATVRVVADRHTDSLTDANRFSNLSHAICCSYGTLLVDNISVIKVQHVGCIRDVKKSVAAASVNDVNIVKKR